MRRLSHGGGASHSGDGDDSDAAWGWKWGTRAVEKIGEAALACFVAKFLAERAIGGGGPGIGAACDGTGDGDATHVSDETVHGNCFVISRDMACV